MSDDLEKVILFMYHHICGVLSHKSMTNIIVESYGIGYELEISHYTSARLPEPEEAVKIYVHYVIREDAHILYGFIDDLERQLFRLLIKVSGVGPKLALNILSHLEPAYIMQLLLTKQAGTLVRIPGIGKKMAERIVVELAENSILKELSHNTIPSEVHSDLTKENIPVSIVASLISNQAEQDAISALISLGYKPQESINMLNKVKGKSEDSGELVRLALQQR